MPYMFLMLLGVLGGFALALFIRAWIKACEQNEKLRIRREELRRQEEQASSQSTTPTTRKRK